MKKSIRNRLLLILLVVVLACGAGIALFVVHLDRIVTPQFEGRRWTLPAQVYAQPLELYVGLGLSADELQRELERLHYTRSEQMVRPGSFRRQGARIDFVTRRVDLWDEHRPPQVVRVTTGARQIESLRNARGEDVPILRLDPLLIGSIFPIHGEDRIVVTPQQVPVLLPAALKVVEDRKFNTHHGVDVLGIARAAWVNLRAGTVEQGASTLTQQLVSSYFLDKQRSYKRKLKEAVMAMILEARFTKADLMNAYINEIYLGQDGRRAVHGFGLASEFYFGKPLHELDLHEIALLVAVVRGPSYYDPRRKPERVLARRNLVLGLMAQFEIITPQAAQAAKAKPLGLAAESGFATGYYPAYLDFVRRTLKRDYREEDLTETGLKIYTTLDPRVQEQAEQSLAGELERLETAQSKNKKRAAATAKCIRQARSPSNEGAALPGERRAGVTSRPPTAKEISECALEGAVVVTSPQSGEVIALVGGRRAGFDGFNRVLDARRSIGSLVKPAVYLTALESGRYTAISIVNDEPIELDLPNRKKWRPENFSHETSGPVPLVHALAESLNLATVNLGLDVGLPKVAQTLKRLGVSEKIDQVPALLLGSVDLPPIEVAQFYGTLASGGFSTPLRAVRAVVDAKDKPLKSFALEVDPVVDPAAVYQLTRMMVQTIERGTGRAAQARLPAGLAVAGKTGTSSDYRDSWFAGFSGSHLAVVWVGYDDNRPTGLTGAAGALAIWSQIMGRLSLTSLDLTPPETVEEVQVEYATGLGAKPDCGENVITVAVPRGTQVPLKPGCGGFGDWWRAVTH